MDDQLRHLFDSYPGMAEKYDELVQSGWEYIGIKWDCNMTSREERALVKFSKGNRETTVECASKHFLEPTLE